MYDITSTKSFHKIEHWVDELKKLTIQQNEKKIPVFIIGNKADLQFLRTVEKETVLEKVLILYSKLDSNLGIYGYESKEVNGIDENNVQECMKDMIAQIFVTNLNEQDKEKYERMYAEDIEN
jgi:GTPase SAR1 family protein